MFGSAQKGIKHWILNRFLLVNSEMWIRTAIKLPHDLGFGQKTVGNSAGDFYRGGERKTQTSWIRTAIKSPTTPCKWWKSLTSPWETITVRIGLLTGGMIFPPLSGMLDPCQFSSNNWKLISFDTTWLYPKLKKKTLSFSLFIPSLVSLHLFEQCLRLVVTSTSSVCLPLQDESLYVFPNCKSLWIKASAKWLNVNVNHKDIFKEEWT